MKDKNKELYTLAHIDSLTKIRNRRSFFIESEEALNNAIRKNQNLCILIKSEFASNSFNLEKKCEYCSNDVPAEGIIIRKDGMNTFEAYKLKAKLFLFESFTSDIKAFKIIIANLKDFSYL